MLRTCKLRFLKQGKRQDCFQITNYHLPILENNGAIHHHNWNEEFETDSVPRASNFNALRQRTRVARQSVGQKMEIRMVEKPPLSTIEEIMEHGNSDEDVITPIPRETSPLPSKSLMKQGRRLDTSSRRACEPIMLSTKKLVRQFKQLVGSP